MVAALAMHFQSAGACSSSRPENDSRSVYLSHLRRRSILAFCFFLSYFTHTPATASDLVIAHNLQGAQRICTIF